MPSGCHFFLHLFLGMSKTFSSSLNVDCARGLMMSETARCDDCGAAVLCTDAAHEQEVVSV